MDDLFDLSSFIEKVLIKEKEKEVKIKIDLKEMLEENEKVTIILQIDGEDLKQIEVRRREERC